MVLAAVLALTLYLPLMAGQLSVASPGFYALGGYIAAILSTKVFHPGPGPFPARRGGSGWRWARWAPAVPAPASGGRRRGRRASSLRWPPSPFGRIWGWWAWTSE